MPGSSTGLARSHAVKQEKARRPVVDEPGPSKHTNCVDDRTNDPESGSDEDVKGLVEVKGVAKEEVEDFGDNDGGDDDDDDDDDDHRSEAKGKGEASGSVASFATTVTGSRGRLAPGDSDQMKLPTHVPARYACYTCVDKGKTCMIVKGNSDRPCLPCDKNKSGLKDGNGVRGKLEADIRRAVYAFENKGKTKKGGKYIDWVPTRVNVDLRAVNPYWRRMISKELTDRVEAFQRQTTVLSEAGKLLARKPKDYDSMVDWRREVRTMEERYARDLSRLKRAADTVEADLDDEGYELEVLDLGPKQKKKKK
ncbi:hypothetical protein CBS101457_005703 [Exobasidium rhododendri]|nr:hypothetical protein CBS101457_005703 [Exobasidium rhododendri]